MKMKKNLLGFMAGLCLVFCGQSMFAGEISKDELTAIQQKAKAGDAEALNELGVCYLTGTGVEKSEKKAFVLFKQAAEKGSAAGLYNYARGYYEGVGVEQDINRSIPIFQKAVEAGSVKGCTTLGACYLIGQGVEKDVNRGFELTKKAAEKGDAVAEYNLGKCYEQGLGVAKNLNEAEKWFRKAAKDGDEDAEAALKNMKAPAKEPKIFTKANEIPQGYEKIGSTEISRTKKSFSIGKKSDNKEEAPKSLREEVLEQAREKKADAVLILKEKGNAENGYISAEFYKK